jgi:exodeoxyribonuclease VII large subunit
VRGGGSIEDLWAFNDEALARVIATSPVPLVSGVGHETDFTIADFVADLRAPTPTGAAELATPDRQAMLQELDALSQKMTTRVTQRIDRESQRLDQLSMRLSHALPNPDRMREKAEQLRARLNQSWQVRLNVYHQRHQSWASHLELLNPQRTLDRGYAVILDQDGQAVRDPGSLKAGQVLDLHLAQGASQVELAKVSSLAKNASNE